MEISEEVREFLEMKLANARTELVRYNLLAAKLPELQAKVAELETLLKDADEDRPVTVPIGKKPADDTQIRVI